MNNLWQLQEAKSKFSELVARTLAQGVQIVTRRGQKAVVVLPFSEYQRLTGSQGSLVEFLTNSPLASLELDISRDQDLGREVGIEA